MDGIHIADIHIHPYRDCSQDGGQDRLEDGLRVVAQSLKEARRRKCGWYFTGDAKLHRTVWPQSALNGLLRVFDEHSDVPKMMISGQHDGIGAKNTGLHPFKDVAVVIEEPRLWRAFGTEEPIAVWPWQPTLEGAAAWLTMARKAQAQYMFGHGYLHGAATGTHDIRLTKNTIPLESLGLAGRGRVFKVGFMGDVHKAQVVRQAGHTVAFYCGSPYSQRWDELEPYKGCLYFDTAAPRVERIPLTAPRHMVVPIGAPQHLERLLPNQLTGHFVRLLVGHWWTAAHEKALLKHHHPRWLNVIVARPERSSKRADIHAGMGRKEMLTKYMTARPPDAELDARIILRQGLQILERSDEIRKPDA